MTAKLCALTLVAAASAAALGGPSRAWAEPRVEATFGNTVMSIYPDGRSQKLWLQPDGTWTGLSRRGNPLAGKWSTKGEKVCLRQTSPPTLPISFCQALPDNPETGVFTKDLTGAPIHLKLVKGIPDKAG